MSVFEILRVVTAADDTAEGSEFRRFRSFPRISDARFFAANTPCAFAAGGPDRPRKCGAPEARCGPPAVESVSGVAGGASGVVGMAGGKAGGRSSGFNDIPLNRVGGGVFSLCPGSFGIPTTSPLISLRVPGSL